MINLFGKSALVWDIKQWIAWADNIITDRRRVSESLNASGELSAAEYWMEKYRVEVKKVEELKTEVQDLEDRLYSSS